jgi:hypothetical protein
MRAEILSLVLLLSAPAQAAGIGGRVKLDALGYDAGADSAEAALGYRHSSELAGQLRLSLSQQRQRWQFQIAWQLDVRHGSAVAREHALAGTYPALADTGTDTSYWDLEHTSTDSESNAISQRLDRLNLAYSSSALVVRLGRQALTWGSGLVFHPMDLVNPFQPVSTDTAYKRGTDMAYVQWLLADGSDIQLVGVPHKVRDTQDPDGDKATTALFANLVGATLQWNLLLARDRADSVLGLGVSGPWGGAVWNLEVVPTYLERNTTRTSVLMNLSRAGTFLQRNVTTFVEYYHNGFGESGSEYDLASLNTDLLIRLQRGQQFVTGRDYLSAGATWEWTPLLQLLPTLILNLQDHSSLFDLQLNYSLGNDTALKAGLRLAAGGRGSEFGGLETSTGSGLYLAGADQVFVRLESYF